MSLIGWRRIGSLGLVLVPACATYSSLDGSLEGQGAQAGAGASMAGGSPSNAAGSSGSGETFATGATGGDAGTTAGGTGNASAGSESSAGSGGAPVVVPVRPTALTLGAETTDVVREPDPGGMQYVERCPDNQVLIGFHGTVDAPGGKSYLRSAQAICASLVISAGEPWQITVTETEPLSMHDIASAQEQSARCPDNQVMIGFAGRSGLWMDSVDVRCAPLTILGVSPSFLLVAGTASKAATIGGATGGSPFDPLECAAGSVAVGQFIRTIQGGVVLGAFGVQCAAITLETE